jgi:hypothetical protein
VQSAECIARRVERGRASAREEAGGRLRTYWGLRDLPRTAYLHVPRTTHTSTYAHTYDRSGPIFVEVGRRSVISVSVSLGLGLPVSRSQSTPLGTKGISLVIVASSLYLWGFINLNIIPVSR